MKKWLCLLLVGTLLCSLVACHRGQNVDTPSDPTDTNTHISSSDATEGTKPTAEVYADFLDAYVNDISLFYFTKDIDNNGTEELIITQNTELEVYTYENSVKKVGAHDFITGTLLLHYTNDEKYPGIVYVTVGGGKYHFGYITITDGALTVQQTFDEMLSGGKEDVYYTQDEDLIALSRKVWEKFYRIGYSVWEPKTTEDLYAIREITDERVVITGDKKIFNNTQITLSVPANWKCLTARGEDNVVYYFQDPVLGDKSQLVVDVTFAELLYERTPEQYWEYLSRSRQNLEIASITNETIQGYQCTKVVYSYTENGAQFIKVWYDNLIEGPRLYDFSIIYPADQKDIYERIFAAIMDSIQFIQVK